MSHLKFTSPVLTATFIFSLALSSAHAQSSTCLVARQITERQGQNIYTINHRARSLYMISRDLYGDAINWKQIAQWNNLEEPYKLILGQELVIKVPARLSEDEGNKVLIQAWTNLEDKETVQKLEACLPAPAPAPVVEAPAQIPAPTVNAEKPAEPENQQAPSEAVANPPVTESAKPAPLPVEPIQQEPSQKWFWTTALLGSVFSLEADGGSPTTENKLYTKINYGAELSLRWQASKRFATILSAAIEHIEFEPADGGLIENRVRDLQSYSLNLQYHWAPALLTHLGYSFRQRPLYRATTDGASVDALFIPDALLGTRLRLAGSETSGFWLLAEGHLSFDAQDNNQEIQEGAGYKAGFYIEKQVGRTLFNFTPTYEVLTIRTNLNDNKIEAFAINLGLSW